jgi:hypothetical protein
MTEREVPKQTAELLRRIIRSIDKSLEYTLIDQRHDGQFSLRLTSHRRVGIVSLPTEDLRLAGQDNVRRNAIRQKIKSTRDHMLSNYIVDVMGKKITRMLKRAGVAEDNSRKSYFRPSPRRR